MALDIDGHLTEKQHCTKVDGTVHDTKNVLFYRQLNKQ